MSFDRVATVEVTVDAPQTAYVNMQKDAAIFAEHESSAAKDIHLRFYSWLKPAITFGYAQKPEKLIDLARAKELGVDTAKRITGGGMVFHQPNELTYSLVAPLSLLPAGIIPSCNFISEIFIKALRKIGIDAELAASASRLPFDKRPSGDGSRRVQCSTAEIAQPERSRGQASEERDICFARPTKYEVVCGGKKLLGSAQKRGRNSLLQHGSLTLEPPLPVFAEFIDMLKLNQTSIRENMPKDMHNYTYKDLAEIIGAEFSALSL